MREKSEKLEKPEKSENKQFLEGPSQSGDNGFVLLYGRGFLVKPFFEKIDEENAKTAAPADITVHVVFSQ